MTPLEQTIDILNKVKLSDEKQQKAMSTAISGLIAWENIADADDIHQIQKIIHNYLNKYGRTY